MSLSKPVVLAFLLFIRLGTYAQQHLPYFQESWVHEEAPFRVAGNLYYVGSYELASFLIATPQGHILINTGLPGSDTMIRRHVEALGFRWTDIRILLATHAHFDHVGAMAAVKRETGAHMMIHERDAAVLADGGNSDVTMGGKGPLFEPVKADRLLHDLDTVSLGGMHILVLHHPGHTKGANSFLLTVRDSLSSYQVLIANMPTILDEIRFPSMPAYPEVENDYAYTLNAMRQVHFDLWLASHASQFDLHSKRKKGYDPAAFADRAGYDAALDDLQKAFDKKARENQQFTLSINTNGLIFVGLTYPIRPRLCGKPYNPAISLPSAILSGTSRMNTAGSPKTKCIRSSKENNIISRSGASRRSPRKTAAGKPSVT